MQTSNTTDNQHVKSFFRIKMSSNMKYIICCISVFNKMHIPLSGRNPVFQETLDVRPHLLVLNKMDLADVSDKKVKRLAIICAMEEREEIFLNPDCSCPL